MLEANDDGSFLLTGDQRKLTLAELSDTEKYPFHGVDLVTLSACETAAGESGGNEIEGLALRLDERGNGARTVLATLWAIQPDDSFPLIESFDEWLQKGLPKAEALRRAEVSRIQQQPPGSWAPFILIGDWR